MKRTTKFSVITLLIYAAAGFACGFTGGFLGSGGAIAVIFAFRLIKKDADPRDICASAMVLTFPLSLLSSFLYGGSGADGMFGQPLFFLTALAGGLAGALLLERIKPKIYMRFFAAVMTAAGLLMLVK